MQVFAECLPTMRNIPNEKTNMPWVLHPQALQQEETVDIKNNYNTGDKCRNRAWISSIGNPQGADYRNTGEHLSGHAVFVKSILDRRNSMRNVEARSCMGILGMTNGLWLCIQLDTMWKVVVGARFWCCAMKKF